MTRSIPSLLVIVAVALSACSRGTPGPAPAAITPPAVRGNVLEFPTNSPQLAVLQIGEVRTQSERQVDVTGRVVWDETRTTRVFAPVAGRIVQLDAVPGQAVQAGQVLARLSAPDVGQAQSDAARALADLQQADRNLARAKELDAAGAIARRELENAQSDRERAQAELSRARARLQSLGGGTSVDQQFALRSPVKGVVVERHANPGQEFRPDQSGPGTAALFVVSDPTRVWVQLDVPEGYAASVKPGQRVDIRVGPSADSGRPARIDWVSDSLDPQTRTLTARVALDNTDRSLKAEMFVRGTLHLPQGKPVPTVPSDAAVLIQGRHYVFVEAAPGQFRRQPVQLVESGVGTMTVESGLNGTERVVTRGALMLQQVLQQAPGQAPSKESSGAGK